MIREPLFDDFFGRMVSHGLEFFGLYYSTYRGVVHAIGDQDQGLLQVIVPSLSSPTSPMPHFAYPSFPVGWFGLPKVGDGVWVEFEGGRLDRPRWVGTWLAENEQHFGYTGKAEQARGFSTKAGHQVTIDEKTGKILISWKHTVGDEKFSFLTIADTGQILVQTKTGETIFLKEGAVTIADSNGNALALDSQGVKAIDSAGNTVLLSSGGVSVVAQKNATIQAGSAVLLKGGTVQLQGNIFSAILGEPLLTWLTTHTHASGSPGAPTSPPIVPPLAAALLSRLVKLI